MKKNKDHTREYDCGIGLDGKPVTIKAHPKSCLFCDHCTDVFLDTFSNLPYMFFCNFVDNNRDKNGNYGGYEDDLYIYEVGMKGKCEHFKEN